MKDFSEIIESQPKTQTSAHHLKKNLDSETNTSRIFGLQYIQNLMIKSTSLLLMTVVTAPFNTASVLLQISDRAMIDPLGRKVQTIGKAQMKVHSLIKLGVFGDNKIYKPFQFKNYNDCLRQMGKQGVKGLYKGALMGVVLSAVNARLRTQLYGQTIKITKDASNWKTNIYTIFSCCLADLLTMPLMLCQSRLIFQNSSNNFRTYQNPISILRSVPISSLWAGSSLLLAKNILFTYSWLTFFQDSPMYSFIFSTILSHLTVYPFLTLIRKLQCNDIGVPMMNQRSDKAREAIKRIWNIQGFKGFYRGFLGYSLVHLFMGIIVVQNNVRSGYFQQLPN